MADEIIEEKDLSIEDYLALFKDAPTDLELITKRSGNIARIVVKKLRDASGRQFEDTTFIEKTGVQYTIRTVL